MQALSLKVKMCKCFPIMVTGGSLALILLLGEAQNGGRNFAGLRIANLSSKKQLGAL